MKDTTFKLFKKVISKDIVLEIMSFLPPKKIFQLENVSKHFFNLFNSSEYIYKIIYEYLPLIKHKNISYRSEVKRFFVNPIPFTIELTKDLCEFSTERKFEIWQKSEKIVKSFQPFIHLKGKKFTKYQGVGANYAISTNANMCVVASQGNILMLKNPKNPQLHFKISMNYGLPMAISVNKESNIIFSGGLDSTVIMHKISEKKSFFGSKLEIEDTILKTGHQRYIACIKILDDSHVISTGVNSIKQMDFTTNSLVSTFEEHESDVMDISIDQTKNFLLSGSCDSSAKLWDIKSTKCISTFKTTGDVDAVDFHPSGNIISITSGDKVIRLFDIRKTESFLEFKSIELSSCLKFSKEGSHLFAGFFDGVQSYNLLTGAQEQLKFKEKVTDMDIIGDGSSKHPFHLVATSWDCGVYFFGSSKDKMNWKNEFY
jgi:WD40 repeat protein